MEHGLGTLFFKDKHVRLIANLAVQGREWHISDLAKESGVTYVHTSKFIAKCEQAGIVGSERHGRVKRLALTKKGEEVARGIAGIMEKTRVEEQPKPAQQPQKPVPQK